jgi:MSHA biogenesis protein MshM
MENFYPEQRPFQRSELRDDPFSRTAGYAYLSLSFRQALAALYYGLESGSRVLMLSAEPGLGKTTLMRHLERMLRSRGPTLFFSLTPDNGSELLRALLVKIGSTAVDGDSLAVGAQLDEVLQEATQAEKPFVLLLDHENAESSALEVLHRLTSLESFGKGLLRVVIASSRDAAERLRRSAFAEWTRPVPLAPLAAGEVQDYIDHRLRLAGRTDDRLFTAGACELIAKRSCGNPLAINEICFNLLQNLDEPQNRRRDRPDSDGSPPILDESYVNSALSAQKPSVRGSVLSFKRRTAALVGVALTLVLAVNLRHWGVSKSRAARHLTVHVTVPHAAPMHHTNSHDTQPDRLKGPAHVVTAPRATRKGSAGKSATESAPPSHGKTAWVRRVEFPAAVLSHKREAREGTNNSRRAKAAESHFVRQ